MEKVEGRKENGEIWQYITSKIKGRSFDEN